MQNFLESRSPVTILILGVADSNCAVSMYYLLAFSSCRVIQSLCIESRSTFIPRKTMVNFYFALYCGKTEPGFYTTKHKIFDE